MTVNQIWLYDGESEASARDDDAHHKRNAYSDYHGHEKRARFREEGAPGKSEKIIRPLFA